MRARLLRLGLTPTRLILIAAGFISLYFGSVIVGNRVHQFQLDQENTQLEQKIVSGQNEQARLQALHDWMQTDAFVEAMARKQGLVRPGDHAIVVAAPTATSTSTAAGEWWLRYFEP